MFSKSYVRRLADTIISDLPLSYGQLLFLLDIAADYMSQCDQECCDDINRAQLFLFHKDDITPEMEGGE